MYSMTGFQLKEKVNFTLGFMCFKFHFLSSATKYTTVFVHLLQFPLGQIAVHGCTVAFAKPVVSALENPVSS